MPYLKDIQYSMYTQVYIGRMDLQYNHRYSSSFHCCKQRFSRMDLDYKDLLVSLGLFYYKTQMHCQCNLPNRRKLQYDFGLYIRYCKNMY